MSSPNLQGWSSDPFRLHEARYFSAGRPTKLVRDGNVESYDEPPSGPHERAGAVAVESAPGPGATAVSGAQAGGAPGLAGVRGYPAPGRNLAAGPPRRLSNSVFVAIVVLATATVAGIVVKASQSGPTPGQPAISPAAFVNQSAQRTLAQSTAEMTLSGTLQAAGRSVALSGTGETDFGTGATQMSLDSSVLGRPLAEEEVLAGGNLYLTVSIDGQGLPQLTRGREWIQLPAAPSGPADLGGNDPLSSLAVLEQPGIAVQGLGSTVIDGVTCSGYAVTPSRQAMMAGAKEESARLGFSSAMASLPPPTYTVWFDARGLLRQMDMKWQMTALGAMSVSATVDFSHYGSPVQITAPAPSDIIPYRSLLQVLSHDSAFCLAQC